jgi:enoyl-CoA hydratase/carnithine racemase
MIKSKDEKGIAIIELDSDIINAINLELIEALTQELSIIENKDEFKGLILTSTNEKFFSIGFDIPKLFQFTKEEFSNFYSNFNQLCLQLYTFSKPTVALVTGHATAGGCILALCCDYRFISEGRKLMGLNEIHLGVPIPYPALYILEEITGPKNTREVVYQGKFYTPAEANNIGIVDEVLENDKLQECGIHTIKKIEASSIEAFALIKADLQLATIEKINKNLEKHESDFVEAWYRESTRQKLRKAIEKY